MEDDLKIFDLRYLASGLDGLWGLSIGVSERERINQEALIV